MLFDGALPAPEDRTAAERPGGQAPAGMSHEETLAFVRQAGAALAADRALALQRAYDHELAEAVRVPLINRIAAELETLERKSPATRRVYAADCRRFKAFCDAAQTSARPATPEVVCHFLLEQADHGASPPTIHRLRAAISLAHRAAHCFDPTDDILVRATVQHIGHTAKRTGSRSCIDAPGSAVNPAPDEAKGQ